MNLPRHNDVGKGVVSKRCEHMALLTGIAITGIMQEPEPDAKEATVLDLLVGIQHYCHFHKVDFDELIEAAKTAYRHGKE